MARRICTCAVVTLSVLAASPARADTWEARSELSGFSMKIGAPGADVCVVVPASLRNVKCDGVDFASFGNTNPNQSVAAVRGDTYGINVSVTPISDIDHELTNAEARELYQQLTREAGPRVQAGPLIPVRVHGLQAFFMRSEYLANVLDTYWVMGNGGITMVVFARPRELEATTAPIIGAMVESFDATRATSLNARIGSTLLSLLAGAPLVVLAAAIASRKKRHDD